MTDPPPPPPLRGKSKSPPILPAFLTPPPAQLSTSSTPTPPTTHEQQQQGHSRNVSTSDIGVLKLSGQVSQNDDRLPPNTRTGHSSLGTGSESGASGPLDPLISPLPFLDISPAAVNNKQQHDHQKHYEQHTSYTHFAPDSQSVDVLSYPDPNSHPDGGDAVGGSSDGGAGSAVVVAAESSFHTQSDHSNTSINISSDISTGSANHSGESTTSSSHSVRTQTSSQAGGSLNSRSSGSGSGSGGSQNDSQLSDLSFSGIDTSTPRHTPNRAPSQSTPSPSRAATQSSIPSDSSLSSPLSPSGRYSSSSTPLQRLHRSPPDQHGHGRTGGSSVGGSSSQDPFMRGPIDLPGPTPLPTERRMSPIQEVVAAGVNAEGEEGDEERSATQDALDQITTQELKQFDYAVEDDAAGGVDVRGSQKQTKDHNNDDKYDVDDVDDLDSLTTQEILDTIGSTPPASELLRLSPKKTAAPSSSPLAAEAKTVLAAGKGQKDDEFYSSDEDDDISRSNATGTGIDLHMTQETVNLEDSFLPRSHQASLVMPPPPSAGTSVVTYTSSTSSSTSSTTVKSVKTTASSTTTSATVNAAMSSSGAKTIVESGAATEPEQTSAEAPAPRPRTPPRNRRQRSAVAVTAPSSSGRSVSPEAGSPSSVLTNSPSERYKRPLRGEYISSALISGSQEHLASSQPNSPVLGRAGSSSSLSSNSSRPSSFQEKMKAAAEERDEPVSESAASKRPRLEKARGSSGSSNSRSKQQTRVVSSLPDEPFWVGTPTLEKSKSQEEQNEDENVEENEEVPEEHEEQEQDAQQQLQQQQRRRSRSGSQDISSFPDELPSSEFGYDSDDNETTEGGTEGAGGEHEVTGPSTPPPESPVATQPTTPTRRSARLSHTSPAAPRKTSPRHSASQQRKKGSSVAAKGSSSSQPSTTLRRTRSSVVTDPLRVYKADAAVWALWKKNYYAGRVLGKTPPASSSRSQTSSLTPTTADLYDIHFLDDTVSACDSSNMRPLKLKLGANVIAIKSERHVQKASIMGVQVSSTALEQSRVDVRFLDATEANLPLAEIHLSETLMDEWDQDMDWDAEDSTPPVTERTASQLQRQVTNIELPTSSSLDVGRTGGARSGGLSRQSSSSTTVTSPSGTPTKGKNNRYANAQRSFQIPSTPSRRSKGSAQSLTAGPSTPSRRFNRAELFKGLKFVLTLTEEKSGSKDLEDRIAARIKEGGGIILDDFNSVLPISCGGGGASSVNVILIAPKELRTPKYITALALNVARLSHHWIEHSMERKELLPHQSYHLSSGFSYELDAVISSTPSSENGLFETLVIGLCGGNRFRKTWTSALTAAGAIVQQVTPKSGPLDCSYIVFFNQEFYDQYVAKNNPVPTLGDEWLIQSLINQRIVSIHGYPKYLNLVRDDHSNQHQQYQSPGHHPPGSGSGGSSHGGSSSHRHSQDQASQRS
ncbi:hypothetical protein BGZ83_002487 [Gryganskiella cystojenkinii]|nr:hypothetical protein BGZ83_002487 [Gryganskiella cystojenkinii]